MNLELLLDFSEINHVRNHTHKIDDIRGRYLVTEKKRATVVLQRLHGSSHHDHKVIHADQSNPTLINILHHSPAILQPDSPPSQPSQQRHHFFRTDPPIFVLIDHPESHFDVVSGQPLPVDLHEFFEFDESILVQVGDSHHRHGLGGRIFPPDRAQGRSELIDGDPAVSIRVDLAENAAHFVDVGLEVLD